MTIKQTTCESEPTLGRRPGLVVQQAATYSRQIKIIRHISFNSPAFLYQEYRDTSKQQEIEQRRQRDNLPSGFTSEVEVPGSTVTSPPVVQLQLRNSARSLSLWQTLEAVQQSGLLATLSQKEIIMQEVSVFVTGKVFVQLKYLSC